MIVPLFTGAARALYESLDWPSTEMEQWRRTDLRRLLPKGTLDKAAAGRKITIEPIEPQVKSCCRKTGRPG